MLHQGPRTVRARVTSVEASTPETHSSTNARAYRQTCGMAHLERADSDEPANPALLFGADGRMDVIHDLALTNELLDSADEVYEAFDGLGRPLQASSSGGTVAFHLTSREPAEAKVRARVRHYYSTYASRHPTRVPPDEADLTAFILAVANDEVIE